MRELQTSCHTQSTEYYQTLLQIWHHDIDHSSLTLTLHDRGKIYIGAWVSSQHPVILSLRNTIKLCFKYDIMTLTIPLLLSHYMTEVRFTLEHGWAPNIPSYSVYGILSNSASNMTIMTLTIPLLLSHMTEVRFPLEHGWAPDILSSSVYGILSNSASNMTSWHWPFLSYSHTTWQR